MNNVHKVIKMQYDRAVILIELLAGRMKSKKKKWMGQGMGKEGGDTTYFSTVESQKMISKAEPRRDNPYTCLELWEQTGRRGQMDGC